MAACRGCTAAIELKRNDPPATSTPWQLPKPGDPLYDAEKEAQIKRENASQKENSRLVRVFERGVFKGYDTLSWGEPAKKMGSGFTPNSDLHGSRLGTPGSSFRGLFYSCRCRDFLFSHGRSAIVLRLTSRSLLANWWVRACRRSHTTCFHFGCLSSR